MSLHVASRAMAVVIVIIVTPPATGANPDDSGGAPTLAVPRQVIANGGGESSGGVFAIRGTLGQADADPLQPSTGGAFAVAGGFWPGAPLPTPLPEALFAHGFEQP